MNNKKTFIFNKPLTDHSSCTAGGVFLCLNNRVFVIAFSLIALQQPIGKDSKSKVNPFELTEYFTQDSIKKVVAMTYKVSTTDLQRGFYPYFNKY